MASKTIAVLLTITLVAIIASVLFLWQGGFGGGHGGFDRAIFIMGLPWAAVPWPDFFVRYDFVWLIGLPFVLNIASVLLVSSIIRTARHAIENPR